VLAAAPLNRGCSSAWAQGGIAAALSEGDTPELHADDTVAAGAGLVDAEAAHILATEGPAPCARSPTSARPSTATPPGTSPRAWRPPTAAPASPASRATAPAPPSWRPSSPPSSPRPHIEVRENVRVRCLLQDRDGAVRGVLAEQADGRLVEIVAPATVLATGGLGGLYAVTTNPAAVRGEGLALAALAGAVIADPEFVQFHPTAIDVDADPAPLATEALRGEGAILVDGAGRPFMRDHHALAELAPRDVVARAIHRQRLSGGGAFLDATKAVGDHFPTEFPGRLRRLPQCGHRPADAAHPRRPAVHYHMGGIVTDLDGKTSLPGLYAAGECASTGVHGANRLASNSLLEAAVFGARAGRAAALARDPGTPALPSRPAPDLPTQTCSASARP
jgi:L-aspartate oxidase